MQKNHQPDHQFLQEMGALLAARAGQSRTVPPAVTHLADYVMSARRHQQLTRAALAQKMGVTEAEIYALEQGLLSYPALDLGFLSKLATALDEEIETLLLLLGRPALVQAIQRQKAHRVQYHHETFAVSSQAEPCTTASKQRGNRFGYRAWANALYKGCLNLIDSLRQGRLSSTISVNYQWHPMQWRPIAALLICCVFIGVSTYSISIRFDAQSNRQARATPSARPDGLWHSQIQQEIEASVVQISPRLSRPSEAMTQSVTTWVDGSTLTMASVTKAMYSETQQCVLQAVGRPAICRV